MLSAPEKDAEYWAIRLENGPLDASEEAEFDAWLEVDERRSGALLRAQGALAYLNRGRALHSAHARQHRPVVTRRGILAFVGGGIAAATAGAFLLFDRTQSFTTRIGEVRQVALSDGSTATLNTDSRLLVDFHGRERRIALASGEAWFQVAHDRTRPFIVETGKVRVRAVGTAFSVRLRNGSADVLVTEGVVETWIEGHEAEKVRFAAGCRAQVTDGSGGVVTAPDPARVGRALSWRGGQLALDGETVDFAVEEINRYNRKKIIVDSPRLGHEPLVGYFRTNEPEKFSSAVAALTNAHVIDDGTQIHLVSAD
ncbi:FecR family protein [Asticcacaulis sp. 201]|uniref:FecR family protein n=1 Tax=Asticcacaulis sp. 201 TaxID=3028787 RepID=UPI002916D843|nr:FecR domain-containing protein [Asticcacaulis sp. 201]MDV6331140.1 FecR domain-containing protein [Asticcacaulis sp. 201]